MKPKEPMEPVPSGVTRVLAVGAHPDDVEFFGGGLVACLIDAGAHVHLVVCTDGSRGGRGLEDALAVRSGEQDAAVRALGIAELTRLGHVDGELEAVPGLVRELVHEIRRTRPDLVLGHDPRTWWTRYGSLVQPGHSDHRAAGGALLDAVYPRAQSPNFFADLGLEPFAPGELWLFDAQSPEHVVDVTPGFERKLEALRAHTSQKESGGGLLRAAEAAGRHFGGERRGEAFVRLRLR